MIHGVLQPSKRLQKILLPRAPTHLTTISPLSCLLRRQWQMSRRVPPLPSLSFSSTFTFDSGSDTSRRLTPANQEHDFSRLSADTSDLGVSYRSLGSVSDFGDPEAEEFRERRFRRQNAFTCCHFRAYFRCNTSYVLMEMMPVRYKRLFPCHPKSKLPTRQRRTSSVSICKGC
ncbi:hypothetical protein BDR07DRAFT_797650 [Suillus spraguei]|nr:hypothetical protein BDR07DRAFT_797650 [Suillus spraguei]